MAAPSVSAQPESRDSLAPATATYDGIFWACYAANALLLVSVSLLYRYSDLVSFLGGGEWTLGWIVGVGAIGSIAMRGVQGFAIDRFGARWVWLVSLTAFTLSILAHLALTTANGPAIYAARLLMATGLAGSFGASLTYVSLRAPRERMGEMIGVLGSSGFVGLGIGQPWGTGLSAGNLSGEKRWCDCFWRLRSRRLYRSPLQRRLF